MFDSAVIETKLTSISPTAKNQVNPRNMIIEMLVLPIRLVMSALEAKLGSSVANTAMSATSMLGSPKRSVSRPSDPGNCRDPREAKHLRSLRRPRRRRENARERRIRAKTRGSKIATEKISTTLTIVSL